MLDKTGYGGALLRDLQNWRSELSEIDNRIAVLQVQRDALQKRVVAAEVLLGDVGANESDSVKSLVQQLMADGKRRRPKDVRHDLVARGIDPARIPTNSGNLYNALLRLTDDRVLKRDEDGVYWNPAVEKQELEDLLK